MDAQALLSEFLGSEAGAQAMSSLAAQGMNPASAQDVIGHAIGEAHSHVEEQAGILGNHPGKSFFAAFATGLIQGDGLWGSVKDGFEGVLGGRIAGAVADRAGLDSNTATTVAAALTPLVASFLKNKLN